MPRKTMRMSEIRALANRILAGSNPEMVAERSAVASMYESLAMAAGDYHGYNDIVQVWSGEPGHSTYVPDETYRRVYYGEMSGPDAQAANDASRAYRENHDDTELRRRRIRAHDERLADGRRAAIAAAWAEAPPPGVDEVICGDCGDQIVNTPAGYKHSNDGTPQCQGRDDAAKRQPARFAPGQQPGQDPAPGHNCKQCGCET